MDLILEGLLELVCEISASKNTAVPMPQVLLCQTTPPTAVGALALPLGGCRF